MSFAISVILFLFALYLTWISLMKRDLNVGCLIDEGSVLQLCRLFLFLYTQFLILNIEGLWVIPLLSK